MPNYGAFDGAHVIWAYPVIVALPQVDTAGEIKNVNCDTVMSSRVVDHSSFQQ
jgi:hypothetical protein